MSTSDDFLLTLNSSGNYSEDHRSKREALLAELRSFISQTCDYEFALSIGESLQMLPEVAAYSKNLWEINELFRPDLGIQWKSLDEHLMKIRHDMPALYEDLAKYCKKSDL